MIDRWRRRRIVLRGRVRQRYIVRVECWFPCLLDDTMPCIPTQIQPGT